MRGINKARNDAFSRGSGSREKIRVEVRVVERV
jgi:hypothetical protein